MCGELGLLKSWLCPCVADKYFPPFRGKFLLRYVFLKVFSPLYMKQLSFSVSCMFHSGFLCNITVHMPHRRANVQPVENEKAGESVVVLWGGVGVCWCVIISQERGKGWGGEERRGYKPSPAEHPANTSETRNKTLLQFPRHCELRRTSPPLHRMARCLISSKARTL